MSEKTHKGDLYPLDQFRTPQSPAEVFNSFHLISADTQRSILDTAATVMTAMEPSDDTTIDGEYKSSDTISDEKWDLTWSKYHIQVVKHLIPPNRIEQLRNIVKSATRQHQVFSIYGNYISVRRALIVRGWVEKISNPNTVPVNPFSDDDIYNSMSVQRPDESRSAYMKRCEQYVTALLFRDVTPDFIWNYRLPQKDILILPRSTVVNRLLFNRFATKAGLASVLASAQWFTIPKLSHVNFPRCYLMNDPEQQKDLMHDYKITASISLLVNFRQRYLNEGVPAIISNTNGKLPLSAIYSAIQICYLHMSERQHEDLDTPIVEDDDLRSSESFLEYCYQFVHMKEKFINNKNHSISHIERIIQDLLNQMPKYWPQMSIDGIMNIWIVKPAARCRGIGIRLINNYKELFDMINDTENKSRFVCQKYIESPLLIYDHKFDIRQWFLVTSVQPITVWIYKKCYIRFSSKPFNLTDFHEVVHLTNNSVQHKYRSLSKDATIPPCNMWDLDEFKCYLKYIKKSAQFWDTYIFPQIKQAIACVLLASEDSMMPRMNSFQMFGADIMIDVNFKVWLIEVNSCPQMAPTTPITQKLCPECFDDVIKVIVDRSRNSSAPTGHFENLYLGDIRRETINHSPSPACLHFEVLGKRMPVHKGYPVTTNYHHYPSITTASRALLSVDATPETQNDKKNDSESHSSISIDETEQSTMQEYDIRYKEIESHYENAERLIKRVHTLHGGRAILSIKSYPEKHEGIIPVKSDLKCFESLPANLNVYAQNSAALFKNKICRNFSLKNVRILYSNKTFHPQKSKQEQVEPTRSANKTTGGEKRKKVKIQKAPLQVQESTITGLDSAQIIEECKKNIQKIERKFKQDFEKSVLNRYSRHERYYC